MIRIGGLQEAHMPDVLRIQDECYTQIVPESLQSLRAKRAASPATCFVAEAENDAVGYLFAVPIPYPQLPALNAPAFELAPDADTLYLHDLAVARGGRGTGAGTALVRRAMEAGRALRLQRACLVAIQGSAPYWRQFGFEAVAPPSAAVASKLGSYGAAAQLMVAEF